MLVVYKVVGAEVAVAVAEVDVATGQTVVYVRTVSVV